MPDREENISRRTFAKLAGVGSVASAQSEVMAEREVPRGFLWGHGNRVVSGRRRGKGFGIHHVDYATQKRTPKLSADFYREVIARNAIV